jgi:hypothetical protein
MFLWLIGGEWRKVPFDDHAVPPFIHDDRYCSHLWFGFRHLSDECLSGLSNRINFAFVSV